MLSHWLKCGKNRESKNPKVAKTKNGRIVVLPKYAVCDSKKLARSKEASGLLGSLGIKTPLNKIPLLGPYFF